MFTNLLHTYNPQPILLELGFIEIRWYGFFMALAILAGFLVNVQIAKWYDIKKEIIYDLFFYLIIFGFIGARIFYVLYNFSYFWDNPIDVFKIWEGGIAIHGALIFGILILASRRIATNKTQIATPSLELQRASTNRQFWLLAAIIAPGVALGQAIGRWGNYFNQELFGLPTDLPWGIPIALANRPIGFENFEFFHPTFLYESVGSLVIFAVLLATHWFFIKKYQKQIPVSCKLLAIGYLTLYSILRFFIEFLRIDETAGSVFGMRATMGLSLLTIVVCMGYLFYYVSKNYKAK